MGEKISSSSAFVSIKLITPAFVVIGTFFRRWQNPRFLLEFRVTILRRASNKVPLTSLVVPLVLEAHSDVVASESPQLLHQPVVVLLGPFAAQKFLDCFSPLEKLGPVSPLGILGVRERYHIRVPWVPRILRSFHFGARRFFGEGREWWPGSVGSHCNLMRSTHTKKKNTLRITN